MKTNIGVHVSIAGGLSKAVERAAALGCSAFQIFCRSPRSWAVNELDAAEVERFRSLRAEHGIGTVAVHTTYLINLASIDDKLRRRSIELFKWEMRSAEAIGADFLVTHMGSAKGGDREEAVARVEEAVSEVAGEGLGRSTTLLLENTAGAGQTIGSHLSEVGRVARVAEEAGMPAGLCFDTCHGFAAGLPMRAAGEAKELVRFIDDAVGIERLRLVHLNDSKGDWSSNLDRHEHIGRGSIKRAFLKAFLTDPAIRALPLILETPKDNEDDDVRNLKAAEGLRR